MYRVQPSRTVDFYKTSKKDFCHSLLEIRRSNRTDDTFTKAVDLIPNQEIQMPYRSSNNKNNNDDFYSAVDQQYHREVVGKDNDDVGTIAEKAMLGNSKGRSRVNTVADILDILLAKNRSTKEYWNCRRGTNTSRVVIGRMEPITSSQGLTQTSTFSAFGESDPNESLTILESQLSSDDQEAVDSLHIMSSDINVGESQTNDNPDLSVSQQIIEGIPAFQVDVAKPIRKNHSIVKDVSHDYLSCFRPFFAMLSGYIVRMYIGYNYLISIVPC